MLSNVFGSVENIFDNIDRWAELQSIGNELKDNWNTNKRWSLIRKLYALMEPEIIDSTKRGNAIDPYVVDWTSLFTPIEDRAWEFVREYGLPLMPQYPVGQFFVDFGNPYWKLAVELDGKAYHDEEKDTRRDEILDQLGWVVIRIPGSMTYRRRADLENIEPEDRNYRRHLEYWLIHTCDGVFASISRLYQRQGSGVDFDLAHMSLSLRRLVDRVKLPTHLKTNVEAA